VLDLIGKSQKYDPEFCNLTDDVKAGLIDPYSAAKKIIGNESLIIRWLMRLGSDFLWERRNADA